MVRITAKLEKVLGKLKETPYEPLKEEQEEGVLVTMMEKQGYYFEQQAYQFLQRECAQS
jgi:hypothetical protein